MIWPNIFDLFLTAREKRPVLIQISCTGYHFDQILSYDVMIFGQNLKMLENWLYFWIPHPEINLDVYFEFYSSTITLLDIEFDPIFYVLNQTGRWNLKNIRKLTSLLGSPSESSVNTYFQHFNSITLLDIEFWPHFPCAWPNMWMWRNKMLSKS